MNPWQGSRTCSRTRLHRTHAFFFFLNTAVGTGANTRNTGTGNKFTVPVFVSTKIGLRTLNLISIQVSVPVSRYLKVIESVGMPTGTSISGYQRYPETKLNLDLSTGNMAQIISALV